MWLLIYGRERQNKWLLQDSTSVVVQQCDDQVSFQRNGPVVALKFLLIFERISSVVYSRESTFYLLKMW